MSKKMTAFGSKFIQTAKAVSKKRKELAEAVGMEAAGAVAAKGDKKARVSRCMVEYSVSAVCFGANPILSRWFPSP